MDYNSTATTHPLLEIWLPESHTTVTVTLRHSIIKINDVLNASQLRMIGDNKKVSWWWKCLGCGEQLRARWGEVLQLELAPSSCEERATWGNEWTCNHRLRNPAKCHMLTIIDHSRIIYLRMASSYWVWSMGGSLSLCFEKLRGIVVTYVW